ncbi:MAG: glycoside hydrolase family 38 C-terminal domain-containing protein [Planctomycetota bacterium]
MNLTPLRRYADPLMLMPYLRERVVDLYRIAIVDCQNLLPARAFPSDGSITPTATGSPFPFALGDSLEHPFVTLEAEVTCRDEPETCPAMHFKCGDRTEAMLCIDGQPVSGIGTAMWDDSQPVWLAGLRGEHHVQLQVERDEGYGAMRPPETSRLERFEALLIHEPTFDLAVAIDTACEVYAALDEHDPCRGVIRRALLDTATALPIHDPVAVRASAPQLYQGLLDRVFNGQHQPPARVLVCGHAHIDLAWLWPRGKARRKSVRTFAAQLELADRFPWARFQQGQFPLYDWARQDAPELFERVQAKLASGAMAADGSVYVEPDTHAPGLESLIRQLTLGRRRFGAIVPQDSRAVWMPDCFGFSGALPQLFAKAGIRVLFTSKISWSEQTRFPHDTFRWYGPDGSSVLVYFLTTPSKNGRIHCYNTDGTVEEIDQTWRHYQQRDANQTVLMAYGFGDGGGGPREVMHRRMGLLRRGATGFLRVEPGTPSDLADHLTTAVDPEELPTWHDELYLEHHRGTYSSQATIKSLNTLNERLLLAAEACDALHLRRVDRAEQWETLLFAQFHDILPGTSVEAANRQETQYLSELRDELRAELDPAGEASDGTWFNANGWGFQGRWHHDGRDFVADHMPAYAAAPAETTPLRWEPVGAELRSDGWTLGVDDTTGAITSILDAATGRAWLGDDGFTLRLFEDRPHVRGKDAWLLDAMHEHKTLATGITVTGSHTERCDRGVRWVCEGTIGRSAVRQTVTLLEGLPLVYIDLDLDWNESQCVLKAIAHAAIRSDTATYASQGTVVSRPTHRDRLEDGARFEVPAQGWVDLGEADAGLTLMAVEKFGFSCRGSRLGVTLLRSPISPDPRGEAGRYRVSLALSPHTGTWQDARTPWLFGNFARPPLRVGATLAEPKVRVRLMEDDGKPSTRVLTQCFKHADEGAGLVVRACDTIGSRGSVRLILEGQKPLKAALCDLHESPTEDLPVAADGGVVIAFKPFEIVTVRLHLDLDAEVTP